MAGNKAVAYIEPGKVEVQTIDYPKLEVQDGPGVHPDNVGRKTPHGAILKIVSTNICARISTWSVDARRRPPA
jgi:glutathione-independent formaldehyde dehydrogenase